MSVIDSDRSRSSVRDGLACRRNLSLTGRLERQRLTFDVTRGNTVKHLTGSNVTECVSKYSSRNTKAKPSSADFALVITSRSGFQSLSLPKDASNRADTKQPLSAHVQTRCYNPKIITQHEVAEVYETTDWMEMLKRYYPVGRPLGGIEHMYSKNMSEGADIICLMTKIRTTYSVTAGDVLKALIKLQMKHPLLSMRIEHDPEGGRLKFVEHSRTYCDFKVSDNCCWHEYMLSELEIPFDEENQPLVRYRMLNSGHVKGESLILEETESCVFNSLQESVNFCYEATFLFIMHHAVMDGGYSLWMFQELIKFLDEVIEERKNEETNELPVLPPMEEFFTLKPESRPTRCQSIPSKNSVCRLKFSPSSSDTTLLNAYNEKFKHEIKLHDKPYRNDCIIFQLSKQDTNAFKKAHKIRDCSPKSVIAAAGVFALLELVYNENFANILNEVTVPIEFMLDFRRVCDPSELGDHVTRYPGVASFHVPSEAKLRFSSGISKQLFWEIASGLDEYIKNDMCSQEMFSWLRQQAKNYLDPDYFEKDTGKSPYVLNISNMGKLDGVLNCDLSRRVRLVDLHGHSSILVDNMPIFFITTFLLNGHFCGNVSFSVNYTSNETATKYVGLFQKWLGIYSKL